VTVLKKISEYLNLVIFAVLVVYAGIYFFELKSRKPTAVVESRTVDVDQVVNKFIKQTSAQALRDEMAYKRALQTQLNKPLEIKRDEPKIRPEDIPREQQIWKDKVSATPAESIQSELYQQQLDQHLEEMDKAEYARQFIENARNSGFHVVLSPDNKVISVTPIRKPSQNEDSVDLFPAD